MANVHTNFAKTIIKHQEGIIGPLSWSQASRVSGIVIKDHEVLIKGDGKIVLESLVKQYETLFGRASVEACKDAVRSMITPEVKADIPEILQ